MSSRFSRRREDDSAFFILLVLAAAIIAVTAGVAIVAWLMYLPLRTYGNDEPGKAGAVVGIILTVVGLLIGAYELLDGQGPTFTTHDLTALSLLPFGGGVLIYALGLSAAVRTRAQYASFVGELEGMIANSRFHHGSIAPDVMKLAAAKRLSAPNAARAVVEARALQGIHCVENGYLPVCDPPELVFLREGEQCHAWFSQVGLHGEVKGRTYTATGAAVYWTLSPNITVKPSAYSGESIPVAHFKRLDTGCLLISNLGVSFQGERSTYRVPFGQVLGLGVYRNGFQIHHGGKAGRELFEMSPRETTLAVLLISHLVRGDLLPAGVQRTPPSLKAPGA